MEEGESRSARQWALRALGRRMHTAYEIRAGLAGRGFDKGIIESVMTDLLRLGYINDLDFARAWIASRSAHRMHGRLRLLRDLKQKGIPGGMAESVLEEMLTDEDEVAIAVRAVQKKMRAVGGGDKKGRERLYRHLLSRGFTAGVAGLALAQCESMEETS